MKRGQDIAVGDIFFVSNDLRLESGGNLWEGEIVKVIEKKLLHSCVISYGSRFKFRARVKNSSLRRVGKPIQGPISDYLGSWAIEKLSENIACWIESDGDPHIPPKVWLSLINSLLSRLQRTYE